MISLAIENGQTQRARILIENNVKLNERDKTGSTALLRASFYGFLDIIQQLLAANVDINEKDSNGNTALSIGICFFLLAI